MLREELRALDTSRRALRSFGLVVGAVFVIIAGFVLWRHGWSPEPLELWLAGVGSALVLLGLAVPDVLRPIHYVWMGLALVLGHVMTRVLLTIVFFVLVTPLGLVRRALRKDPMRSSPAPGQSSYWVSKTYLDESPQRLEKMY